jgi:integrase
MEVIKMIGFDKKRKTYFVKVKYHDPVTNKQKQILRRGFKLKREAAECEHKLKYGDKSEPKAINQTTRFCDIVELWEDTLQSTVNMKETRKTHFLKRFKDYYEMPLNKFTKEILLQWRIELSKMPYSTRTKNNTIQYVKGAFRFASDIYGIPNVAVVLKNLKKSEEELQTEEMSVWTVDQFNQFLEHVHNPLYAIFFHTLFWTGARRGEIIALQCSDLTDHEIYIHQSLRRKVTGVKSTKTKTNRHVRLDDVTYSKLLDLKKEFKHGFLFGGDDCLAPQTVQSQFERALKESGLPPIRLHDLRHSHATWLINSGVNIVAVSKRLGHADINTTLKTYTHLLKDTDDKMMQIINDAVK